ncbi:hypothetical protein OpiT1DRAFT_01956 [Opitutaceae bacterium TAV1]|nr:hypothetical protein OPIT5_16885 [Opitutaceae bacterium TAV5]EIP97515.1 hypothetical protein OpiT1DRAFT_01956 [Opitutaceae bacterium TAV1]
MPAALPAAPLALLRRLEWRVRGAVENVLGGEYRSAFRGRGMEFDQVVKYEFGDDVRDIDWNVTARLGEPYRKKFVEEREVTVLIVFEDTPSLQFGSGPQSKREALLELAGLLMLLGAVNRDRVGFVHVTPHGHTLQPPVRGRGAIHHAAAQLFGFPPPPLDAAPTDTADPKLRTANALRDSAATLTIPWKHIRRAAPRHSMLVWLGDFAPRPAPEGWPALRQRFQTRGFRVDDPWERELPATDRFAAYDPVSGRLVTLENSSAERAAHAAWRAEREAAWRALFPAASSRLVVGTDESRLDALMRFFTAKP